MKRFVLLFLLLISYYVINAQTFVVVDYIAPAGFSQERIEEAKKIIGTEVTLLFTDDDVKMTMPNKKGELVSKIHFKKGKNIYRRGSCADPYDCRDSYDEIELNTILGYIRSFKYTHIHHNKFGGGIVLERK